MALEVADLTKSYGDVVALRGMGFSVRPSELMVLSIVALIRGCRPRRGHRFGGADRADRRRGANRRVAAGGGRRTPRSRRSPWPTRPRARRRSATGSLDALVAPAPDGVRVVVDERLDDGLRATLTAVARERALGAQISSLGGDSSRVDREIAAARLEVRALDPDPPYTGERVAIGIIAGAHVYLALLLHEALRLPLPDRPADEAKFRLHRHDVPLGGARARAVTLRRRADRMMRSTPIYVQPVAQVRVSVRRC